jgi:hypothetical protein
MGIRNDTTLPAALIGTLILVMPLSGTLILVMASTSYLSHNGCSQKRSENWQLFDFLNFQKNWNWGFLTKKYSVTYKQKKF